MCYVFVYGILRVGQVNDIGYVVVCYGIVVLMLLGVVVLLGELYDFGMYLGMIVGLVGKLLVWGDVYEVDEQFVLVFDEIECVYLGVDLLFKLEEVIVEFGGW